jgi:hypothetical protein
MNRSQLALVILLVVGTPSARALNADGNITAGEVASWCEPYRTAVLKDHYVTENSVHRQSLAGAEGHVLLQGLGRGCRAGNPTGPKSYALARALADPTRHRRHDFSQ